LVRRAQGSTSGIAPGLRATPTLRRLMAEHCLGLNAVDGATVSPTDVDATLEIPGPTLRLMIDILAQIANSNASIDRRSTPS